MLAYLIVDVEDLLSILKNRAYSVDFAQIAGRLRMTAALAVGLFDVRMLKSIAVADWDRINTLNFGSNLQAIFQSAEYETFDMPDRGVIVDALAAQYFSYMTEAVDELIIVTGSPDLTPLLQRARMKRDSRVRIWAKADTPQINGVIYQPIDQILGIQEKNVALYIDFENIAISLMQNKYVVNIDRLISAMVNRAAQNGQIRKMAAYAPWGQRGGLPALVDDQGAEVSDSAPSKLAMSNIDPVYNLPGKNSADMRIARDVLSDSTGPNAPDVFIIASGDRDFNELFINLKQRGKTVIVWGVQGSTSNVVANNPNIKLEYIDNFAGLSQQDIVGQTMAQPAMTATGTIVPFAPSQFSTLVIQYDLLAETLPSGAGITEAMLQERLKAVNAVTTSQRARELIDQALGMNIMRRVRATETGSTEAVKPIEDHVIVERTRLIRDRIAMRVANTLDVRDWEYVNYGFLLRGIAMDNELMKPGLNVDDSWRSLWVDALVREGILQREMVPHRMNPDDLVPVIKLPTRTRITPSLLGLPVSDPDTEGTIYDEQTGELTIETQQMIKRVITSVDQFTSYRGFTWCPLRSLHMRMKDFDSGVTFQRAVEYLEEAGAVVIDSYSNPQSEYKTKGISLELVSPIVQDVLAERDRVINVLLDLYDQRLPINFMTLSGETNLSESDTAMWLALMKDENVLNEVAGKPGVYSLFRTHHTVNQVAERRGLTHADIQYTDSTVSADHTTQPSVLYQYNPHDQYDPVEPDSLVDLHVADVQPPEPPSESVDPESEVVEVVEPIEPPKPKRGRKPKVPKAE